MRKVSRGMAHLWDWFVTHLWGCVTALLVILNIIMFNDVLYNAGWIGNILVGFTLGIFVVLGNLVDRYSTKIVNLEKYIDVIKRDVLDIKHCL
ncbi:hypothetical protein JOC36_001504 [Weissella uvarum]|uniref:hypothetical protein n=1 Tax=Weissella uvarum TaxID=1479233 RepID=UPI0019601A5F|nr:hypothetical protein [Weissella uvarum]MBM7617911.1 hypothetical protein [Weissella uvarum]MCM0596092.1 hypothetical protein [Weissella uvarum]